MCRVRHSPLAKTAGMNTEIGGTKHQLHGSYHVVQSRGLVNIGAHQVISVCLALSTSRQTGACMTRIGRLAHAFITHHQASISNTRCWQSSLRWSSRSPQSRSARRSRISSTRSRLVSPRRVPRTARPRKNFIRGKARSGSDASPDRIAGIALRDGPVRWDSAPLFLEDGGALSSHSPGSALPSRAQEGREGFRRPPSHPHIQA